MFSIHKFIEILHNLLLKPIHLHSFCFYPSFSTNVADLKRLSDDYDDCFNYYINNGQCIWWNEEPIDSLAFDKVNWRHIHYNLASNQVLQPWPNMSFVSSINDWFQDANLHILANSEKSQIKKDLLKDYSYYDWYFFFHGFAALDWFRDYKYLKFENQNISKVFISLNHLITKKRSYRITLLSQLIENQLLEYGHVSYPLLDKNLLQTELIDAHSYLSPTSKKHIFQNLLPRASNIILDSVQDYNMASSSIINPSFGLGSLWHLVTETVYYEERLHLTEKIFKPIVLRRPFILIGAPGNLEYLRSYGFQTFDRWIDESYDEEKDPDIRLLKIIDQLKKLCALPHHKIIEMHSEMNSVLEFNYNHFYGFFKNIILDELITNFEKVLFLYNKDKSERFRIPEQFIDFDQVRKILNS